MAPSVFPLRLLALVRHGLSRILHASMRGTVLIAPRGEHTRALSHDGRQCQCIACDYISCAWLNDRSDQRLGNGPVRPSAPRACRPSTCSHTCTCPACTTLSAMLAHSAHIILVVPPLPVMPVQGVCGTHINDLTKVLERVSEVNSRIWSGYYLCTPVCANDTKISVHDLDQRVLMEMCRAST